MSKPTPQKVFGPDVQKPLERIALTPEVHIDYLPSNSYRLNATAFDDGVWSLEETQLQRVCAGGPLAIYGVSRVDMRTEGEGVAIREIIIRGVLLKNYNTAAIAREIRHAAADEDIDAILLRIDSPGGHTAGIDDVGREVRQAASVKPIYAIAEDLAASAGYWIASQASKVFANAKTAMVGSIGAYFAIYDFSGMAGQAGIKPVVIKSGEFKGAGIPGTEITAKQQEQWQGLIDSVQAEFNSAVSKGRNIPLARVMELADGRVHMAEDAVKLGLIDGIQTLDETIAQLAVEVRNQRNPRMRTPNMAESTQSAAETLALSAETIHPRPATLTELKGACEGAGAEFLMAQLEANATLDQARTAWTAELRKQNEATAKALAESQAENEQLKVAAQKPGVKPLVDGGNTQEATASGDPIAEFDAMVQANVEAGMLKRAAIRHVAVNNPELHAAYLESQPLYRPKRGRTR